MGFMENRRKRKASKQQLKDAVGAGDVYADEDHAGDFFVLLALAKQGVDFSAPRHVLFHTYFDDEKPARAFAKAMTAKGLEATVNETEPHDHGDEPDTCDPWSVTVESRTEPLLPTFLMETRVLVKTECDTLGGEYDGWEAAGD